MKLALFPSPLNFRWCQVVPGSKCKLRCLVSGTECPSNTALFSFITWHLLLKGRTKGEIQRSHGECSKNGTLRTATLSHKWSWKTRTLLGFLGVRQSPESWRVRKMHMPWWKWWPRLHSHSRTCSSRAPLSAIGEVFVGLVPKWAFCGLGGKGNKVKASSLLLTSAHQLFSSATRQQLWGARDWRAFWNTSCLRRLLCSVSTSCKQSI